MRSSVAVGETTTTPVALAAVASESVGRLSNSPTITSQRDASRVVARREPRGVAVAGAERVERERVARRRGGRSRRPSASAARTARE